MGSRESATYDRENDVLYVRFSTKRMARTRTLDARRLIDLDRTGEPVGIEFIAAGEGLDLNDVPQPDRIQELLTKKGITFPIVHRRDSARSPIRAAAAR